MKQFIKETIFTLLLALCFGGNLFARDELVFDLAKETGSNLLTSDFVQIYFTDATLCIDTGGKGLYYQLEIGGKINFQVESFDVVIREIVLEYANGKSYTHPCYVDYSSNNWAGLTLKNTTSKPLYISKIKIKVTHEVIDLTQIKEDRLYYVHTRNKAQGSLGANMMNGKIQLASTTSSDPLSKCTEALPFTFKQATESWSVFDIYYQDTRIMKEVEITKNSKGYFMFHYGGSYLRTSDCTFKSEGRTEEGWSDYNQFVIEEATYTFRLQCERGYVGCINGKLCGTSKDLASEFTIIYYGGTNYLYDVTHKSFVIHTTAGEAGTIGNEALESQTDFSRAVTGLTWGETNIGAYPWYLADSFGNWLNMNSNLNVCMNTWKDFEDGNGGNTYKRNIVNKDFDVTKAIAMLDSYFSMQLISCINLDKTSAELNEIGQTVQLNAIIAPDDAANKDVVWTSSDESVATVDGNGLVTSVANGVATITATTTDGTDLSASCTVYVNIPVIEEDTPKVAGKTFTLRCARGYVGYDGSALYGTTSQETASEFAIVGYEDSNYLYDVTNKAFVIHTTAAKGSQIGNRLLENQTDFSRAVTGLSWGKTGIATYPWYLEDSFTNWLNMGSLKDVNMNTWKDFEGGNGGNTYQVEIVNENFDATEAIQMLDNYFQTAVEVTDEQYQAALNSVGTDTQYAIYTLKGRTRYYLTNEGYLTAEPTKDCVLTFARTEGDGLFHSPGWKVDACFTNPHLSEEGGASGALLPQGHILTDKQGRDDWDGQVWYLGDNGCYAVRATNAVSDTWGANTYWTVLDNNGDGVPEADYSWTPAFIWLLESDVESVGIRGIDNGPCNESGAWYTLDGRKLSGKPATKGIFIRNNKKVPVK